MLRQILILSLFLYSSVICAQGISCDQAGPICADNTGSFVFQNNNESTVDLGIIACLETSPRPAWFFFKVDQTGDLKFQINQWQDFNGDGINNDGGASGLDVDFVCWGPFSSENSANCSMLDNICSPASVLGNANGCPDNIEDPPYYINNEDNSNIIDCSYDIATSESLTINNVNFGEFYILLVTNWTGGDGLIEIVQTNFGDSEAGLTDCSIVNTDNYCIGDVIDLDATTPNAVTYEWFQDGTLLAETGPILTNVAAPSSVYTATAFNNLGTIITAFEFIINFEVVPVANAVTDMLQCDDDNDGQFDFDLNAQSAQILGAQDPAEFIVAYHLSQTDADDNLNAVTSPFENTTNPQTIYARIKNNKWTDCFDTTSFIIQVFDSPTANTFPNQLICDNDNDGIWSFDLVGFTPLVLDTQDPAEFSVTYHLTQNDADSGLNSLASPYLNVSNPQTMFIRIENNSKTDCFDTNSFTIEVLDQLLLNPVSNQLICDDNNDGFWSLDLDVISTRVLGTQSAADFAVTYHISQVDADANANVIASPYTNLVDYQQEEIFIRIENNLNTDCYETSSFNFEVFNQPTATTAFYGLCDDDLDGDNSNGFVTFDLSTMTAQILNGQDPVQFAVTYHLSQTDADSYVSALPLSFVNTTVNTQQLVARVENVDNTDCYETAIIDLVVYELPTIVPIVELFQCDDDADGFTNFNLEEANELISTNHLNEFFSYHNLLIDAENGLNEIANTTAYLNIDSSSNPDILYVRIENSDGCIRVSQLNLIVSTTQIPIDYQLVFEVCDDNLVDGDDRNGIATFDFSDADMQITGLFPVGQPIIITYYETLSDALAETNAIININNYRNDISPNVQNIIVRIDNNIDNSCLGLGEHITLRVNTLPIINLEDEYLLCLNANGTETVNLPIIDTGLSDLEYSFEWTLNNTVIIGSTQSTYAPTEGGTYSVLVTNIVTGCQYTNSTIVNESASPIVTVELTSLTFADNHVIEATAIGNGVYVYNLDNGPWQESNIFENVLPGEHLITASDINGCGTNSTTIIVIDYPLYFTPNGDGFHDTWNIIGISNQVSAKIFIYDRYGKLLKQLSPTSKGWDGSFNGNRLPNSDYWFTVQFIEPKDGELKVFKSHFTLKR